MRPFPDRSPRIDRRRTGRRPIVSILRASILGASILCIPAMPASADVANLDPVDGTGDAVAAAGEATGTGLEVADAATGTAEGVADAAAGDVGAVLGAAETVTGDAVEGAAGTVQGAGSTVTGAAADPGATVGSPPAGDVPDPGAAPVDQPVPGPDGPIGDPPVGPEGAASSGGAAAAGDPHRPDASTRLGVVVTSLVRAAVGDQAAIGRALFLAPPVVTRSAPHDAPGGFAAEVPDLRSTFPMILAIAMLAYLFLASRLDRRDPKLTRATTTPDVLRFE